jgi:putative tryptophan/tyrosine transport system substrate-binding protein
MMERREFITLLGGAAAAWPVVARAQQPRERVRRMGVLISGLAADDPEWQARSTALVQGLQHMGWSDGRNIRIDFRWGLGDPDRLRKYAVEMAALKPDILFAGGAPSVEPLQRAAGDTPIVFANVVDPVGAGFVASLARPGGNVTGFMSTEFGLGAKWLELLKQIAPGVKRVMVLRNSSAQLGTLGAIQAVAPSLGVELTPLLARDAGEAERGLTNFARGTNGGLIITGGGIQQTERELIVALSARLRLPAVYSFRGVVAEGGLISYGVDQAELYRLAAGYVDRILRGEKPSDLPVQAPTKYETVLNMKTAKALGLTVPDIVLLRADEVIE